MAKIYDKFILATKLGMTQIYTDAGKQVGVTLLQIAPNVVTQVKTDEKDGYSAVQLGMGMKKEKNLSKGLKGHLKGSGAFRWLREFRLPADKAMAVGDKVEISQFAVGDVIRCSGTTKGKGFAGAVKRHGFAGAPASHGHGHVERHVGSIGQRFPQHTLKGLRGPGRDGSLRQTNRGLQVMAIDPEAGILAVKGMVPGAKGSLIEVSA
ncbi:MAG TPA: 50S ribosomal protein L3 [Candidatus Paceibacterota bacterium]|nr:50S ribosomal protein L3 [Candidatus Paceibacterota bacterium]